MVKVKSNIISGNNKENIIALIVCCRKKNRCNNCLLFQTCGYFFEN